MMLASEFRETANEVFEELLPKVKGDDRQEFITELIMELKDKGLSVEDDESEEDSDDTEELVLD